MVLVDELIVGSGDTISGKVLHAFLQPHRDFCSFFELCEDLLAILADATRTPRARWRFFHATSTANRSEHPLWTGALPGRTDTSCIFDSIC
eukprot:scaffold18746_cov41-Attheya_sp.AAC.2